MFKLRFDRYITVQFKMFNMGRKYFLSFRLDQFFILLFLILVHDLFFYLLYLFILMFTIYSFI